MTLIEWILALLGHVAISCVLFNHVHAFASPRYARPTSRKITEKLVLLYSVLPLPFFVYAFVWKQDLSVDSYSFSIKSYLFASKLVGVYFTLRWIYRALTRKIPVNATLISREHLNIQDEIDGPLLHGRKANLLDLVPGNQVTHVAIENWDFQFPQLPTDLDGFKICQLSDLHFTGIVDQAYFEKIVELANSGCPDVVLITGDIVDNDSCVPWVGQTLAKLESKYGVFFVLGNHDQMVTNQHDYRQEFSKIGFVSAAEGKWNRISVGDAALLISGNEIPWYNRSSKLPARPAESNSFSILLSHSPDQVGWAINRGFDLMFAGHTHGGQIRLPVVGPIIAPSRYGIKYAAGTFKIRNMLMHVSRGLSGDEPIRINCPPELGFFTLVKQVQG